MMQKKNKEQKEREFERLVEEQHSTFHKDMLQRSVKRRSKSIYLQNLFAVIFFVFLLVASTVFKIWPWWILIPLDLVLGIIVVEGLIISNDFRKVDVQSREGLLSLREYMRKRSTLSKRQKIFALIVGCCGGIGTLLMLIYFYLYQFDEIFSMIGEMIVVVICWSFWLGPYVKKESDDFVEEIDELLKE